MILNLCDFCGRETDAGTDSHHNAVDIAPRLTKRWKRTGHTETRYARVKVQIGIDGINPEGEHAGHDLCPRCKAALLRTVANRIEGDYS